MKSLTIALTCLAALSTTNVYAGLRVESVTRDTQTGKEQALQIMQVQNGMARIEASGARSTTIFKNDTMYVLDSQRKTYMPLDRAALERAGNTMNQAMEQMRAQMAAMPPERRAQMEQMMKQNGMGAALGTPDTKAPVFDAKATGGSGTYQGKSCKMWDITSDGKPTQQICVVPYSALANATEMKELATKMQSWLGSINGPLRQMINNSPLQQSNTVFNKIGGFPVITRQYKDGVLSTEETVIKVWQSQAIDAKQFDIPADYTKQEMPTMPAPR